MPAPRQPRQAPRLVHPFDSEIDSAAVLGGKGAGLARIDGLGLTTPPGFTVATDGWRAYVRAGGRMPPEIAAELAERVGELEAKLGRRFGDGEYPLLVSVRSGAPASMAGMMDTLLNLGMNDEVATALAGRTSVEFAWSLYRRLLSQFATVVRGLGRERVGALEASASGPRDACAALLDEISAGPSRPFPQRPEDQLVEAVEAVWRSWDGRRARRYRRYAGIPDDLGTAVTVQAMVFGTYDERSGTGVVFSRDPASGSPGAYGDFLGRAQGDDVVAGGRRTKPVAVLRALAPEAYEEIERALPKLEAAYRDICEVEFTVERGRLWILQARPAPRSGAAAVRIAVDLVEEGLIDVDQALARIPIAALAQLQAPVLARGQSLDPLGSGTPAAPGAAVGRAVFDPGRAQALVARGEEAILVRPETSPEDIAGMIAASGIVTALGGRTSHAAVVARGIGRPAVCGVENLDVDPVARVASFGPRTLAEGQWITVDGGGGLVLDGRARLVAAQPESRAAQVLGWCEERRRVDVAPGAGDGYLTAGEPDEVEGERVLIDIPWEGPSSQATLERMVQRAKEVGVRRLALRHPEELSEGDVLPPPAPWTLLVAQPDSWPARLLATRMASG